MQLNAKLTTTMNSTAASGENRADCMEVGWAGLHDSACTDSRKGCKPCPPPAPLPACNACRMLCIDVVANRPICV